MKKESGILKSVYHIQQYIDEHPKTQVPWWKFYWDHTKGGKELHGKILDNLNLKLKIWWISKKLKIWVVSKKRVEESFLKLNVSEKVDALIISMLIERVNNRIFLGVVFELTIALSFVLYFVLYFIGLGYLVIIPFLVTLVFLYSVLVAGMMILLRGGGGITVHEYLPKPTLKSAREYLKESVNLYKSNDVGLLKFGLTYRLFLDAGRGSADELMKEKDPTSKFKAITLQNLLYDMETKLVLIDELDTNAKKKGNVSGFLEEIKENLDAEDWLGLGEVSKKIREYHNTKIDNQLKNNLETHNEYFGKSVDIFKHETLKERAIEKFKLSIVACVFGGFAIWIFIAPTISGYERIPKEFLIIPFVICIALFCWMLTKILELKESEKLLDIIMKFLPGRT